MAKAKAKAYRVHFAREDGWWIVRATDLQGCHSNGRTLDEARRRIREAISVCLEGDAEAEAALNAELIEDVELPASVRRSLAARRQAEAAAEAGQKKAIDATKKAAVVLSEMGLSRRDAGSILGLSGQRVQQLIGAVPPAAGHRSGVAEAASHRRSRTPRGR